MIFVTLGTHEQGFDRLMKELDRLKESGEIKGGVLIQGMKGKYSPKFCGYVEMLNYDEICDRMKDARIVITHGGPGSILQSLSYGKIPIVVPRMHKFGEHVDDHQIRFVTKLAEQKKIIAVFEMEELGDKIVNYEVLANQCLKGNSPVESKGELIRKLEEYCSGLLA